MPGKYEESGKQQREQALEHVKLQLEYRPTSSLKSYVLAVSIGLSNSHLSFRMDRLGSERPAGDNPLATEYRSPTIGDEIRYSTAAIGG